MRPLSDETISLLNEAMSKTVPLDSYPSRVLPMPVERIAGTAFFPGGSGLYLEDREPASVVFPVGGVMILGHNFDSEAGFMASVARGKEKLTSGTWAPLLRVLKEADIPLAQCFFTNAFIGLCEGNDNRKYRGRDDGAFRAACRVFLSAQIDFQRPRLIVTLGLHVPRMIAELSPDLSAWIGPKLRLTDIDAAPLVREAGFRLGDGSTHRAVVVPIAHPSRPNGCRRKPAGFSPGRKGEIEAVRAGWRAVLTEARA